jgi:hypothetical protein
METATMIDVKPKRDAAVWKALPAMGNGFVPHVKRVYRLRSAPLVQGELSFGWRVGARVWYVFEPLAAMHCEKTGTVGLADVCEVK